MWSKVAQIPSPASYARQALGNKFREDAAFLDEIIQNLLLFG